MKKHEGFVKNIIFVLLMVILVVFFVFFMNEVEQIKAPDQSQLYIYDFSKDESNKEADNMVIEDFTDWKIDDVVDILNENKVLCNIAYEQHLDAMDGVVLSQNYSDKTNVLELTININNEESQENGFIFPVTCGMQLSEAVEILLQYGFQFELLADASIIGPPGYVLDIELDGNKSPLLIVSENLPFVTLYYNDTVINALDISN